jgi:NAD(P)-dependent dehydrogenase (short-subunit alcohol dehydrogenase family)
VARTGRLADKVCLITGAGSGIGRASALAFATEGALVAVADIDGDAAADTVAAIVAASPADDDPRDARAFLVDVADPGSTERLAASVGAA